MPRLDSSRLFAAVVSLVFAASVPWGNAAPPTAQMPEQHRAFFKSYCVECHGAKKQKGKVRLDDLGFNIAANVRTAEAWQKILASLNSGDMPPEDEKQPTNLEKTAFLEELSNKMVVARRMLTDQGGVITMRRLNRREYENTLRELLGVSADVKALPADTGSAGFDTVGKSLFFSSDQFEQYLAIARSALNEAIVTGPKPETRSGWRECEETANALLTKQLKHMQEKTAKAAKALVSGSTKDSGYKDLEEAKFFKDTYWGRRIPIHEHVLQHPLSKTGALLTLSWGYPRDTAVIPADAPPGDYVLRVRAGAIEGSPSSRHFIEIGQAGEGGKNKDEIELLGCHQITGTPADPQILEIPVTVRKSGDRSFILRERQQNNRLDVQKFMEREVEVNGLGVKPSLWLDSVEWKGPIVRQWPPEAHQRLFFKGPEATKDDAYAREIVARFAAHAFRGKEVKGSFLDKLMRIYAQRRGAGDSFEVAVKEPLAIVLASPSFLYLTEPSTEKAGQRALTALELANRISYFLWSAPPDEELMSLARSGELSQPAVLARQVDRLIAHPKSWEFVTGFTSQWLRMERLDFFQFDARRYPKFDHSTKLAARDEVFHTFQTVLRENLGLGHLLKSDFIVVNDLLADYYGITGVTGGQFRKVSLPPGSPRGGMLGMAAILAMGSDGERSSPVERGAFVLRRLLNAPPPPAPANVPQLSRLAGRMLPARELLAAHMEQAQCAQCHRRIDPVGYGLENFDAAGLWRTEEVTEITKGQEVLKTKSFPIDPAGTLPDGTAFNDYFGLREAIAQRTDAFARGLTEALIEYALGRPFGFSDEDFATDILTATKKQDHRLRAIVHAIVASKQFQSK